MGILIGRFQPFHFGHQFLISRALEFCEKLILVIGSADAPRSLKNPFNLEERLTCIEGNLESFLSERDRIKILSLRDYPEDKDWVLALEEKISPYLDAYSPVLIGHEKDLSTYYLKLFPQWTECFFGSYQEIHATEIREAFFAGNLWGNAEMCRKLPLPTQKFLHDFEARPEYLELKIQAAKEIR